MMRVWWPRLTSLCSSVSRTVIVDEECVTGDSAGHHEHTVYTPVTQCHPSDDHRQELYMCTHQLHRKLKLPEYPSHVPASWPQHSDSHWSTQATRDLILVSHWSQSSTLPNLSFVILNQGSRFHRYMCHHHCFNSFVILCHFAKVGIRL